MIAPSYVKLAAFILVHSWYGPECCNGADCHPVPDGTVQELKDGIVVRGFPMMSYSDPRLHWSEDDRDHICARGQSLFCIYRRPKEF
jgi:hypothetical protein